MRELLKKVILFILVFESKLILKRHKPFIIGVTGNIGKTTTKDSTE
jgi:UDP-N-acetylmuramyl pentapeptide synthase